MAYSREYLKNVEYKSIPRFEKFSVTKQFQKLKPGQRINLKCEGYEFDAIINRHNECYVLKNEREVLFRDIAHIDIEKRNNISVLLYIVIPVFIFLAWYFSFKYIQSRISQPDARGQFGDTFGAINALFSGLAFGGIIVTIILQMRELRMQRKELKDTRKEFEMQNSTMKLQRFENTFFNLISNHSNLMDILQKKSYSKNQQKSERYEVLETYAKGLNNNLTDLLNINTTRIIRNNISPSIYPLNYLEVINFYKPIAEDTILIAEVINSSEITNRDIYYRILKNSMSISEVELFTFYCEFSNFEEKQNMFSGVNIFLGYLNKKPLINSYTILPPKFQLGPKHGGTQTRFNWADRDNVFREDVWVFQNQASTPIIIENLAIVSQYGYYQEFQNQIIILPNETKEFSFFSNPQTLITHLLNYPVISISITGEVHSNADHPYKLLYNFHYRLEQSEIRFQWS